MKCHSFKLDLRARGIILYSYPVLFLERFFEKRYDPSPYLTLFLAVVLIALGFYPIRKLLLEFSKRFIKEKYDFQKTLKDLSTLLLRTFDLEKIFKDPTLYVCFFGKNSS